MRGIERRLSAGRHPLVASVASLFVSRWDKAIGDSAVANRRNRQGVAVSGRTSNVSTPRIASLPKCALAVKHLYD